MSNEIRYAQQTRFFSRGAASELSHGRRPWFCYEDAISRVTAKESFAATRLQARRVLNHGLLAVAKLDLFSTSNQGAIMILIGMAFAGSGFAMIWLGRYLFRGLRFLYGFVAEWIPQLFGKIRRIARREYKETVPFRTAEFNGGH